jgi:Raf kinase inhibitor-like YbhB/YbcL family protein
VLISAPMKLHSDSFNDGDYISTRYALGKRNADGKIDLTENKNPHLAWSDLPAGTRSVAILCYDRSAPTKPDDVNQEGRLVPADLPRADFAHWVLVDVAPDTAIQEGAFSDGATPHGKSGPDGPEGTRSGINDYTGWFGGDPDMAGDYYGYDGPCPPFNDAIVHRYDFAAYALDIGRVPVEGTFTGPDVLSAIEGQVLGQANLGFKYTINPDAKEL